MTAPFRNAINDDGDPEWIEARKRGWCVASEWGYGIGGGPISKQQGEHSSWWVFVDPEGNRRHRFPNFLQGETLQTIIDEHANHKTLKDEN